MEVHQKAKLRKLFLSLFIVILYFLSAKLGLSLAFAHTSVSPVWPPTGVALTALLLLGPSLWPAVFLGAFLSNLFLTPVGPWVSLGIAIGNTLEAYIGTSLLLRAFPLKDYFVRFTHVVRFFLGCLPGTVLSASIGTGSLLVAGRTDWKELPILWLTWWIGDITGALVVAPWVLSFGILLREHWHWKKVAEFTVLTLTAVFLGYATFGAPSYHLTFIHIPLFVLAGVRFRSLGAATMVLVVSTLAIRGTLNGLGPFAFGDRNMSLLMVQLFVLTGVLTAHFIAALVEERRTYIEELTRNKRELQESELRFRQLAESIREVFYISTPETSSFIYLNPAFETIWHQKRQDIYAQPSGFFDPVHPEDKPQVRGALEKQQRGEMTSIEYRLVLPDGNINWIWDRAFPITEPEGATRRVAGIAEDITLRKEIDEELRRKAEALSHANRELEHFASVVSHDLRAPLRTVASFVKLLQKKYQGRLDDEADQFIEFATDGCKRMDQLIEDLLRNARTAGKELDLQPLDLKDVVSAALEDLHSEIQNSHARISIGTLPTVQGDPTQVREVFQNLISNALKYRREEAPAIIITAERKTQEWVIAVKDNGIGISKNSSERIFSHFVRLHKEGAYEGSGIGLATCKKVVEQRGGKIWVESTEGEGSVFFFTIPDRLPDPAHSNSTPTVLGTPIKPKQALSLPPSKTFEILMVEDNPADSNIIEILLKKENFPFRIHVVNDGEAALAFVKRLGAFALAPVPSLILLDLNLPKLDGIQVLKEIKSDPSLKTIPVIIITSSVRQDDIRASYEYSASCYIKKPRDLNGYREMLSLLRKFWFEQVQLPNPETSRPAAPVSKDMKLSV